MEELQTFVCATCGRETTELRREEASDYPGEREAEQITGIRNQSRKSLNLIRNTFYRRWLKAKLTKTGHKAEVNEMSDADAGQRTRNVQAEG